MHLVHCIQSCNDCPTILSSMSENAEQAKFILTLYEDGKRVKRSLTVKHKCSDLLCFSTNSDRSDDCF